MIEIEKDFENFNGALRELLAEVKRVRENLEQANVILQDICNNTAHEID